MKRFYLILIAFIALPTFSQQNEAYRKYIDQLKTASKMDSKDKAVFHLLDDFYLQALQSDKGELDSEMPKRIRNLYEASKTKNRHLLVLFMAYQNHITETAAAGKRPNSKFQMDVMSDLENEFKTIFNRLPAIIFIYKAEALQSAGLTTEALAVIENGLIEYPDAVPLKVYKYLETKNEDLKNDLMKNHPNHWMVLQFEIK